MESLHTRFNIEPMYNSIDGKLIKQGVKATEASTGIYIIGNKKLSVK